MNMSLNTLRTLMVGIKAVKVTFVQHATVNEDGIVANPGCLDGAKNYHYLVKESEGYEVNDLAVARSGQGSMGIVVINEILEVAELNLERDWQFSWLVQKVDWTSYKAKTAQDKELVKTVRKVQLGSFMKAVKDDLLERLGDDGANEIIEALTVEPTDK